jgi:hypothetical protein
VQGAPLFFLGVQNTFLEKGYHALHVQESEPCFLSTPPVQPASTLPCLFKTWKEMLVAKPEVAITAADAQVWNVLA